MRISASPLCYKFKVNQSFGAFGVKVTQLLEVAFLTIFLTDKNDFLNFFFFQNFPFDF